MPDMTPYGRRVFQQAILDIPKAVHLYVDNGELKGYGYSPKRINANEFDENGSYPELLWVFSAEQNEANVQGMYVTDANGKVLYSEQFPQPYRIQNQGDRVGVSIDMAFLGALGGDTETNAPE